MLANSEPVAVEVNQRCLIDKMLARYPGEFSVFRELLQNADDAVAKNFTIDFQTRGGTKQDLDSVKVFKWLVKNDGDPFEEEDWSRLTKIAEGNPDERKIGAFGVGFYSIFGVTDKPTVKSKGKMASVYYESDGDKLYVKTEECNCDNGAVIEMQLKQESPLPQVFELTKFLVTSMTFLVNIKHVTVCLDGAVLSHVTKSRKILNQSIPVPEHMVRTSWDRTMSIKSVQLISQEVKVVFVDNPLVGAPKIPITRVDPEESERDPTTLQAFFSTKAKGKVTPKLHDKVATPIDSDAASEAPSLKGSTSFSTKCFIYSADVAVLPSPALERGLESAMKKKLPKGFPFEMVFFDQKEHDKQTEIDGLGFGSVFRGSQGLCPRLQGEHAARIFIGQSTTQTTGMACHMSGRFIPTVERGSIDLSNGHVAKWNQELLYIGGFLARMAYDSEMNKIYNAWSMLGTTDAAKELALYTMKSFAFNYSTPDPKVSTFIKDAFFDCSTTNDFPLLSDQGIRPTKDIRRYHVDFAPFMQSTPVLENELHAEIKSMVGVLPDKLRVRPYSYNDVVDELKSRWLTEQEMAACLRWCTNTFEKRAPLTEDLKKFRGELLRVGKARSGEKEIKLSVIQKYIEGPMLNARNPDDPLPEDTIPPALLQALGNPYRVRDAFGWQEMPITHWLRFLKDVKLDPAHDIRQSPNFASHVLTVISALWQKLPDDSHSEVKEILKDVAFIPTTSPGGNQMLKPNEAYFVEADVFRDLPVIRSDILDISTTRMPIMLMLEYLGVQRRCDIHTFISKAMNDNRWDAIDLARYLMSSPEHTHHVMQLELFPCSDGKRHLIKEVFASTDTNRRLGLPVINCANWDFGPETQLLIRYELRQYPTIEELIKIASQSDHQTRLAAFSYLCEPERETGLEKELDPSRFATYPFIFGIRNNKQCFIPHEEVFSDPSWTLLGFGKLLDRLDKKVIPRLKIRDRPTAAKLFQVLESNMPNDPPTAAKWFKFLGQKGVFSAGDFAQIADLKIVPVPKSASEQQEPDRVTPRECFLKSESDPADPFYQQLFKFVDFGPNANDFLNTCGVKERPQPLDILKVLLKDPDEFYRMAGTHEKYLAELRMIAVGHKSLPKTLVEKMHKAGIFLGCRRGKGPEERDKYQLCKVEEVLVADDMESCRTFGDCIFIAPQEELLEKFYSEMRVKSLSACIKYTVDPKGEIQESLSPSADKLRQSITEKIPIFLHEFDDQRFRHGMRLLRWRDRTQFFVRACKHLRVTKRLEFDHATVLPGREQYHTELSAETEVKDGVNVLWIKDHNPDSYDVASALCRLLFATYKKNDVLSLMTILDTPIDVLERRGYDVERILKEYEDNLSKAGNGKTIPDGLQAPIVAPPPKDGPSPSRMMVPRKLAKWLQWLRKDPKLGEVKLSDIGDSIDKVKKIMNEPGGKDNTHISNREHVGGGKKRKNVGYCDEKKVAENDLEECVGKQTGQIKIWKLKGTVSDIPSKECKDFGVIISELAKVFGINQTRCHVFYHTSDSSLMGFNRNDEIFFGLEHYILKHKEGSPGKAYIYWYYVMAHEMAHAHTPYHDEHHELLSAALTEEYLTKLHDLPAVRDMFKCVPTP